MRLVHIKQASMESILPISVNTAYKWHSLRRYPALILKVGNKLFFDFDEWDRMAKEARDDQVKKTNRIYSI